MGMNLFDHLQGSEACFDASDAASLFCSSSYMTYLDGLMKILSLRWAGQCRASSSSFCSRVLSSRQSSLLALWLEIREDSQ